MTPLAIDLFAGTGAATAAFRDAGWEVVRVELDPQHEADVIADVRQWSWWGRRPRLVWASPPCTEFSRENMPWCRTGKQPSLELVNAALRVIRECDPDFWVIENTRGACPHLTPLLGDPLVIGPVCLWGRFPRFRCRIRGWKERLSSRRHVERAAIPYAISAGLLKAINETLF